MNLYILIFFLEFPLFQFHPFPKTVDKNLKFYAGRKAGDPQPSNCVNKLPKSPLPFRLKY